MTTTTQQPTHTPGPWEIFTPADPVAARRITAVTRCPNCDGSGIPKMFKRKKCSRCNGTGKDQYAPLTVAYGFAQQAADAEDWAKVSIANARLIAAAPCLLAALKALLPEGWDDGTMDHMPGVRQARAAIAKAEGAS